MKRRSIVLGGAAMIATSLQSARAQSTRKVHRIVLITPIGRPDGLHGDDPWKRLAQAFIDGMREHGYVDGQNMQFELYSAEGKSDRIAEIAKRALQRPVDVIVAAGGGANEVAATLKGLTSTIPIVLANSSDPVEQGLIASIARPGGNITGFVGNSGPEVEAKRLQLLKVISPELTRVAYLGKRIDWDSPAGAGVRVAATQLGITLLHAEHTAADYSKAFSYIGTERPRGLFVARNPWNFSKRQSIVELAAQSGIVAVYPTREFAEIGGLISYGPSLSDLYRRVAGHVHKILEGGKPADIPVEQPTKLELVANAKVAKALGLTLPSSILVLAEEVLE